MEFCSAKRILSLALLLSAVAFPPMGLASPGKIAPPPAPDEPKSQENLEDSKPSPKMFGYAEVEAKAKELAQQPFQRDDANLPDFLQKLEPDQYQEIRFKPEKSLWREEGLPFQIQALPRGFVFRDRVLINVVDQGQSMRIGYSPDLFDYGQNHFPEAPLNDLGFAGVRIHSPLRKDESFDEIVAFLGASYFRAAGLGQTFGLSARGLAVDTGLSKAEEFPVFREFWLEKPEKNAGALTVYALLDGPSLTGAFRFVIRPGLDLAIEVSSHIFMRKKVERLGIAPLTSMFLRGENTERPIDDYRPEVHDSDGLLIGKSTGEWMWRPLNNPKQLRISVFSDSKPSGYGLMSRDRNFDHYQDLDSAYQLRPSSWVEPLGDWGAGGIYLIEIPSSAEKYDNIVAFWVPEQAALEGREFRYDYRLHFVKEEFTVPSGGKVTSTRVGKVEGHPGQRRFVVDFASPTLRLISSKADVTAEVGAAGKIANVGVRKNEEQGTWRLTFDLEPDKGKGPLELRAILKSGQDILTESWVYQWNEP